MGHFLNMIDSLIIENKKKKQSESELEEWKKSHEIEVTQREEYYKKWLDSTQEHYSELFLARKISDIMNKVKKPGFMGCDYSAFDELTFEERKSKYMQDWIVDLKRNIYKKAVTFYFEENYPFDVLCLLMIEPLAYFEEISDAINKTIVHVDYYYENAIRSVLTEYEDIKQGLDAIETMESSEEIFEFLCFYKKAKELYQNEKCEEAFNLIAHADYDIKLFDDAKRELIKFALFIMMGMSESEKIWNTYEGIREQVKEVFKIRRVVEDSNGNESECEMIITDVIIAEALVYSSANSVDNVNEMLSNYLNMGRENVEPDQYEILRKVFAYLKAYKQEMMVLESMISNNIPRTDAQEKRLIFLRENANNLAASQYNFLKPDSYQKEDGKIVYDYRSITWDDEQITSYFNNLSYENIRATELLVASEWSNNLEIKNGIEWDIEEIKDKIMNCLSENFETKYVCKVVQSSPLNDGLLEYEETIMIEEISLKYPWLTFIMTMEQLAKCQISISIYGLYVTEKDFEDEEDTIKRNSKIQLRFTSIKNKQNPKLNSYITTIQDTIVTELEKYLNSNVEIDSIY